jgi:hypothetical protein
MPKALFWVICIVIIAFGLTIASFFAFEGKPNAYYYAAPVIGSLLVAIGWIVTSANTLKNNERDHTLKLISERAVNEEAKARRNLIYERFPNDDNVLPLPGETSEYPDGKHAIYLAVFEEINNNEYVAWGALQGIYDTALLRNEIEDYFLKLFTLGSRYIPYIRRSFGDDEIWEHFSRLCIKWSKRPPQKRAWPQVIRLAWRLGYAVGFVHGRFPSRRSK